MIICCYIFLNQISCKLYLEIWDLIFNYNGTQICISAKKNLGFVWLIKLFFILIKLISDFWIFLVLNYWLLETTHWILLIWINMIIIKNLLNSSSYIIILILKYVLNESVFLTFSTGYSTKEIKEYNINILYINVLQVTHEKNLMDFSFLG